MATYIQLYADNQEISGSDGVMIIDGRLNLCSIRQVVSERNSRMLKHFPNKIATHFAIYSKKFNSQLSQKYNV